MSKALATSSEICNEVVKAIQDIKGERLVVLDLTEIDNAITDYFIIAEGTSRTHAVSIGQVVSREVSKVIHEKPYRIEGEENGEWILIDYGNVVAHIFQRETREFYNLEELWSDAKITSYEDQ